MAGDGWSIIRAGDNPREWWEPAMAHLFGWQPDDLSRLLPEELEAGIDYLREMRRDGDT